MAGSREPHGQWPSSWSDGVGTQMDAIAELDSLQGCVLAGALGDALGAHVEFLSWSSIQDEFGPSGITALRKTYGRVGAVTDDTQMTVFSLEALIRWHVASRNGVSVSFEDASWQAYQRWLIAQDRHGARIDDSDGWVLSLPWLHSMRGPGGTNLQSLRGGVAGSLDRRINDSRGCGGIMRSAPLGYFAESREQAFERGLASAVVTHSDAGGYLPAAILSAAIYDVIRGVPMEPALQAAGALARNYEDCARTLDALEAGLELGRYGLPSASQLHRLGGGWQGQDALAIAAACVISGEPLWDVLIAAANHDGDSDSTASIAGQLIGARDGYACLPPHQLELLEGRDDLEQLCRDAVTEFSPDAPDGAVGSEWFARYPGVAQ